ncbi:hypothetical protein [Dietzia sp. NCCP-2495]|uniref:hypothetical protein n=1 Tax=Dietzia sp. NCCP-2495 TaxID=2934675 RepID=UPI00222ECFFB|nr:hypothetical protein [Dietzia sp. NCCP-2495]
MTLVLGGASVARAVTAPPLDAHTDLEFSLDGTTWSDAPESVVGEWGCDLVDPAPVVDPDGAIGETVGVDPCATSPGEFIDRTYYVRNSTTTGRPGLYEVGIGQFELSGMAEFDVSSVITGVTGSDSGDVTLFGADTDQAAQTPAPDSRLAALVLAPGASAKVVDTVAVPVDPLNYAQSQSVSPRIWVSFSDTGLVDTDRDGLPDIIEDEIGTDPLDTLNPLPGGTVGSPYGPENFLPITPPGTVLEVDSDTLPPGIGIEDGVLSGTPTAPGTYDIAPVIVGGIIGISVVILWPNLGSLSDSLGGGSSSSSGSDSGSGSDSSSAPGSGGSTDSTTDSTTESNTESTTESTTDSGGSTTDSGTESTTGQVAIEKVTSREGSPSDSWARANSEVRSTLPTTGVGAVDLLLWALTAAAAGTTLILFARRRRAAGDAVG